MGDTILIKGAQPMSWVVTDAALLLRLPLYKQIPETSCRTKHRITLSLWEATENKILPNLYPWQRCPCYIQAFPPGEDVTTKIITLSITRKSVDWMWNRGVVHTINIQHKQAERISTKNGSNIPNSADHFDVNYNTISELSTYQIHKNRSNSWM